jgi:serine/threonine-protein kinase RsbW
MALKAPINRSIVVKSTPSAVAEQCRWILSKLEDYDFSQDDIFSVHLSLEEAFINAIRHGNKMDPKKKIKINCLVGLDKFEVSLTDEGNGFDPEGVPDPRYGENLYKIGGRGLFLMRSYMDVVKFNERGNCVHMIKHRETEF